MTVLLNKILARIGYKEEAMSYPRSKVKDIVIYSAREINEHLIRCYLSGPKNPNWKHWIEGELTPWLNRFAKVTCKNSNKPLEADVVISILINNDLDSPENLKGIVEYVADSEKLKIKEESAAKLWSRFEKFYNKICPILEQGKFISTQEMEKYIKKYFCK